MAWAPSIVSTAASLPAAANRRMLFLVQAGIVHEGRNTSGSKAVVLASYVHEKGKPVATMVK